MVNNLCPHINLKNRGEIMKSHIDSLKQKHSKLEQSIKFATNHHLDETTVSNLKKQKLLLKEEITKLENV